jgi:xanthine dehydrogenase YagR molybdenum-binding subunit
MGRVKRMMETVVQYLPDKDVDPLLQREGYVGKPLDRVDGAIKVKGEANFSADIKMDNLAYAALVFSDITKGKILKINPTEAENAAGVLKVLSHESAQKIKPPPVFDPSGDSEGAAASDIAPLQDIRIYRDSQPIAVVIAETLEQAEYAATLLKVDYLSEQPVVSFDALKPEAVMPSDVLGEEPEVDIGNASIALSESDSTVDNVYRTPRYNHNAIEPHATMAYWQGNNLTCYDATQNLYGVKNTLAEVFDLPPDQVRVISPFVGGGFGGKGAVWDHTILCAMAAKAVGRPVKLVLTRAGVFRLIGGRTPSEQRVALGAQKDGKLAALLHHGITATTEHNNFPEQFTFPARHLYACKNISLKQKIVNLDTIANTFMRAPGESIGTFALESAIDELAFKLQIDPIDLRGINAPVKDPVKGTPLSSNNKMDIFKKGAEQFGWHRNQQPRSQRDGKWLIGQGVATAFYPVYRFPATARVQLNADGSAIVQAAAHEMGMGTATVQLQHAADRLGLSIDKVSFQYGDSCLPQSPVAGGSNQTVSIVASVTAAVEKLHRELLSRVGTDSPLSGMSYSQIEAHKNGLYCKVEPSRGETYAVMLKQLGQETVEAEASSDMPLEIQQYSIHSYGAQFCEIRIHEDSGETRVSRWLGAFDCGRILNPKTALSQFRGGIIMGIGMALTEETLFDERKGRIMNPTLAEYHVPVNLDIPHIDILYNDIPDEHTPLGAHGIGEIGITGAAAAVANAVFNATGKRLRELPLTLDKLMD